MKKSLVIALGLMMLGATAGAEDVRQGRNHNNEVWCDQCGKYIKQNPSDDTPFVQASVQPENSAPAQKACSANSTDCQN